MSVGGINNANPVLLNYMVEGASRLLTALIQMIQMIQASVSSFFKNSENSPTHIPTPIPKKESPGVIEQVASQLAQVMKPHDNTPPYEKLNSLILSDPNSEKIPPLIEELKKPESTHRPKGGWNRPTLNPYLSETYVGLGISSISANQLFRELSKIESGTNFFREELIFKEILQRNANVHNTGMQPVPIWKG